MKKKLIFDLGAHVGRDTEFYLQKGCRVVAVEPVPHLVDEINAKFKKEIKNKDLIVLPYAISNVDADAVSFYQSTKYDTCNSLFSTAYGIKGCKPKKISVPARRLSTLIKQYGLPYFCKIDIEGADSLCLDTLIAAKLTPKYISVETDGRKITQEGSFNDGLLVLDKLYQAGYRQFKLVDQVEKVVLSPKKNYYLYKEPLIHKILWRFFALFGYSFFKTPNLDRLHKIHSFYFDLNTSGPFGPYLDGQWCDYEHARALYISQKKQFIKKPNRPYPIYYCDWHATL